MRRIVLLRDAYGTIVPTAGYTDAGGYGFSPYPARFLTHQTYQLYELLYVTDTDAVYIFRDWVKQIS